MGVGSGLQGSAGFSAESTFGTYVAPTRFLEFTKATPDRKPNWVQGGGIGAGQAWELTSMWMQTHREGALQLEGEVRNKGFGLLFGQLLGSAAAPVQQGGTAAYLQSNTWADNVAKSLTGQVGVPTLGGTVVPWTLTGCKFLDATFQCGVGDLLTATWNLDAQDYSTVTALAAPSTVTNQKPFHFGQMNVKKGTYGAETAQSGIRKVNLKIARPQRTDRQYAGGAGKKAEQIWNGRPVVTGTVETDYLAQADFADLVTTGTASSLVWEFVGPLIAGTYYETIRFTLSSVLYTVGDATLEQGLDVVQPKFEFKAGFDGTNPPIKIDYISTDIAA